MFILRDLLTPLQEEFSNTKQGQKRKVWFAYTLLEGATTGTTANTGAILAAGGGALPVTLEFKVVCAANEDLQRSLSSN